MDDALFRSELESVVVTEVVGRRRRDGSVWKMSGRMRARDMISDDRMLASCRLDGNKLHLDDLDDAQLFQLSANALECGGVIKQCKGKRESRSTFLGRFGDALECCCSFLAGVDLRALAQVERSAARRLHVFSAEKVVTKLLHAKSTSKVREADVEVGGQDRRREDSRASFPSLERLTIRQSLEESGREEFSTLLRSAGNRLRELRLVLRDGTWLEATGEVYSLPHLKKLRIESPQSWRDDVEIESLDSLLKGAPELESLSLGDRVRVESSRLASCGDRVRALRVGALASAGLHDVAKYSSVAAAAVAAGNRHLLGRRRPRDGFVGFEEDDVEDIHQLASLVSSEAASLEKSLCNVSELSMSVCRMNRLSNAMLPKKLRTSQDLARAGARLADSVRLVARSLGTKRDLKRLRLDWINPASSPLTASRMDFWPDVSELVASAGRRSLETLELKAPPSGNVSDCGDEGARELARVFVDAVAPSLSSSFKSLNKLLLDNVVFRDSSDVSIEAPKTLKVLSITKFYRARSFTIANLPQLKHLTVHNDDHADASSFRTPALHTLLVRDCPKLESFVVSADSFASTTLANAASKRRGAAVTMRGTFRHLRSFDLAGSPSSVLRGRSKRCMASPIALLRRQLRHADCDRLDRNFPGWRESLEERAGKPLALARLADEIYEDGRYDEESGVLLNWIIEKHHDALVGTGCSLDLVDADTSTTNLFSVRVRNCSLRVFGSFFRLDGASELILDEIDREAANKVYDALPRIDSTKMLRRLEISNVDRTSRLEPSSPTVLAIRTDAKSMTLALSPRLRQLSLGGSSLAQIELNSSGTASRCRSLELAPGKMSAQSLFDILRALPNLTSLTLSKMKNFGSNLTLLDISTVQTLKIESCPNLRSLNIQGRRLRSVTLARCSSLNHLAIFAPCLADLQLTTCCNITDDLIDTTTSSTFDSIHKVHVAGAKFVTPRFFLPFATSKNRRQASLTMQRCDPSYKARKNKGVVHLDKTIDWVNICDQASNEV